MKYYYDINEGFIVHIEKMLKAQKLVLTIDVNLIKDETLLRMCIESICDCGLCDKYLYEW